MVIRSAGPHPPAVRINYMRLTGKSNHAAQKMIKKTQNQLFILKKNIFSG